jgi:carboxymethylenebutenolidase
MQTQHTVGLPRGRSLTASLALPTGTAPDGGWPGVLVVHEAPTLTRPILDVADVFAARGWAAVVPDLLSSGGAKLGCLVRNMREVQSGKAGAVTEDLRAVLTWLGGREDVDGARTASIGFCMGGAFALLLGSLGPDGLRAVSDNYGFVPPETTDLTRCPPVVGSFGADDSLIKDGAAQLTARLEKAGVVHDVTAYPGAKHSFLTGDAKLFGVVTFPGTAYVAEAAEPAWERIFGFLDEHVRA